MNENKTRRKLRAGEAVIGTFCFLPEPAIVEMAGLAGFDFVIIDLEHAGKDFATIESMVRAAEVRDVTPLVRVSDANEKAILQLLELGAQGIVAPFLQDGDTAARLARSVRYPPQGTRGSCRSTRAALYGSRLGDFAGQIRQADENILFAGMIEDRAGLENVEAIVASGMDVCFLGRADLSTDLGHPGDLNHPDVVAACARVVKAATRAGCAAGNMVFQPSEAAAQVAAGYRFLVCGTDTQFISRAMQDMVQGARASLKPAR